MGEEAPPHLPLHVPRGHEQGPARKEPEDGVQDREEDHEPNGAKKRALAGRSAPPRGGYGVHRLPGHPRDEEAEDAGDEEADGAQGVHPPPRGEVRAQGEQLANGLTCRSGTD